MRKYSGSVIFGFDREISLRVITYRAFLRRFKSMMDMAAISADPELFVFPFE